MDEEHIRNVALFWKGDHGLTSLSERTELIAKALDTRPVSSIVIHRFFLGQTSHGIIESVWSSCPQRLLTRV